MKYIITDGVTEYGQAYDTEEEAQAECDYLNSTEVDIYFSVLEV